MTSFKNISLKILLLVTIIFCFVSVSYAEIVCVKKQVKANKKGVVNLTNSVRVESKACPSGYKLLYNIPKGKKGDTGARGPKGDKGDTGATGPKGDKGDKGEAGLVNFEMPTILPSGTTIRGEGINGSFFIPSPVLITADDVLINYKEFKHQECQGTVENPTAVPGKVCVYAKVLGNYGGDFLVVDEMGNMITNIGRENNTELSKDECVSKAGYRWQKAGCHAIPGRLVNDKTTCETAETKSQCKSLNKYNSYNGWSELHQTCFVYGGGDYSVSKNERYWDGNSCLTKFFSKVTNTQSKVFSYSYSGIFNEDDFIQMDENQCISESYGYADFPYWNGYKCINSETGEGLYERLYEHSDDKYVFKEMSRADCGLDDVAWFRTNLSKDECLNLNSCVWNDREVCLEGSSFGFKAPLKHDGATWAYTAP